MGLIAKLAGLGPLFLAGLILLSLAVFSFSPSLAPLLPYMGVIFPAILLTVVCFRRAFPAAVSYLRKGVKAPAFWYAVGTDIPLSLTVATSERIVDGPRRPEEATVIVEDRGRERGYAVKVLRIADVQKNYETTTEQERMLLLDRMVKAVEGLSDVEAKLVIDRSPSGETAHIILYSEVVSGDEEGAAHSVEAAAKTLATSMEGIGMILIDDISYLSLKPLMNSHLTAKPSRFHVFLLGAASSATVLTSLMSVGLGALGTALLISGFLGLLTAARAAFAVRRAVCRLCGRKHMHWTIGEGDVTVLEKGVLVRRFNGESTASRYVSINGNNNRDLSSEDIDKRLPMYLATFSNLIYTLKDFRIALHIIPQPVGDTIKMAMARADLYGMDATVGGAVSGYLKAGRSMNVADRITHGERPYLISGVVEVRCRTAGEVTWRELDTLDKQLHEARSILDTMNLSTKEVKDGWGASLCHRFLYLPQPARNVFDPNPIPRVKALTRDFVAVSPLAFRRRPLMAKDGIYLGRDEFGRKVFWNPAILHNPHILVLGQPGTGKSTLIKTLIFRIDGLTRYSGTGKPPAIIIIDPAGEYADEAEELREMGVKVTVVDLCNKKYNPLLLSGLSPEQRISRFVDAVLPNAIPLHPTQSTILYQGLKLMFQKLGGIDDSNPSTWTDENASKCTVKELYRYVVYRRLEAEKNVRSRGGSPELDAAVTILVDLERRLRPFAEGAFALDRTDVTVRDLLSHGGVVIVSFRAGAGGGQVRMSDEMQRLITWSILEHIHDHMLSQEVREGVRLMAVIDEGHKFLLGKAGEVPLGTHLREERKFGTSYVIITHLLDDLLQEADMAKRRGVPTVAALVSTTVVFGYGNPGEAHSAQKLLNLTEGERRRLEGFTTGEAFLKWSIDPRPLYFKIEPDRRALVRRRMTRREMLYETL